MCSLYNLTCKPYNLTCLLMHVLLDLYIYTDKNKSIKVYTQIEEIHLMNYTDTRIYIQFKYISNNDTKVALSKYGKYKKLSYRYERARMCVCVCFCVCVCLYVCLLFTRKSGAKTIAKAQTVSL